MTNFIISLSSLQPLPVIALTVTGITDNVGAIRRPILGDRAGLGAVVEERGAGTIVYFSRGEGADHGICVAGEEAVGVTTCCCGAARAGDAHAKRLERCEIRRIQRNHLLAIRGGTLCTAVDVDDTMCLRWRGVEVVANATVYLPVRIWVGNGKRSMEWAKPMQS